jgi:hypothetical protein
VDQLTSSGQGQRAGVNTLNKNIVSYFKYTANQKTTRVERKSNYNQENTEVLNLPCEGKIWSKK